LIVTFPDNLRTQIVQINLAPDKDQADILRVPKHGVPIHNEEQRMEILKKKTKYGMQNRHRHPPWRHERDRWIWPAEGSKQGQSGIDQRIALIVRSRSRTITLLRRGSASLHGAEYTPENWQKMPSKMQCLWRNSWSNLVSRLAVPRDASKYCLHILTVKSYPEIQKLQRAWENPAASLSIHWYRGCCFETASLRSRSRSPWQHGHAWNLWIQTDALTWPSKYLELLTEEGREKEGV